jgi:copper(I)-binding protein
MFEIGVALLLTLAALAFVSLTVWAEDKPSIQVTDAWVRPTIGQSKASAAYMRIANEGGEDEVLMGASSPRVKAVELHQTTMTPDGVMQMRKVENGLTIPAGGSLALAQGGTHLMLFGVEGALKDGEVLTLTLEFAGGGNIDVRVPVATRGPAAAHAH